MKYVRYRDGEKISYGILRDEKIREIVGGLPHGEIVPDERVGSGRAKIPVLNRDLVAFQYSRRL